MDEAVSREKTTATAAEMLDKMSYLLWSKIGSSKEGERLQSMISQLFGSCDSRHVGNTGYRSIVFPYK